MGKEVVVGVTVDTDAAVKNTKNLGKAMKSTEGRLEGVASKMEKVNSRLGAMASGFGILPVIGAFAALGAIMKSVAEDNKNLQVRLGVTASSIKETKGAVAELVASGFSLVDLLVEWEGRFGAATSKAVFLTTLFSGKLPEAIAKVNEEFADNITSAEELQLSYAKSVEGVEKLAEDFGILAENTDITSATFRSMVPNLLSLKTQMISLGEDATPALEKMFKAAEKIKIELEAPARAKAAALKASQEAAQRAQQRIQLEMKVHDEIAKLTLGETALKRRELDQQLEAFKKTTDDKVAIAQFEKNQTLIVSLEAFKIEKELEEKRIENVRAAEEKLSELKLSGLDATRERIQRENDLLAEGGLAGREIKDFQENMERLRDLELEKLDMKRLALEAERELVIEDHQLSLEEEMLYKEQLAELDRQEQETKDEFAEREKERQASLRAMRVQELAAAAQAGLAFTGALAKAGLGAKKAAKVEAVTARLSELLAAWVDTAKSASAFAGQNYPQGIAYAFAAGQHTLAAAFAGKTSSAVGARKGGRIPFVPGFSPVGDAIPARLEQDEIVTPRAFSDEFKGFSDFLENSNGKFGGGGNTYNFINPTFLSGDQQAADELTLRIEDSRERLERDNRIQRAS